MVPIRFTARIEDAGEGGAYVAVPVDIRAVYGVGRLKVHAWFDGVPYDGSVVNMGVKHPDGSVCYILGVRKDIRARIGKKIGDWINVEIQALQAKNDAPKK